jgi:hypothetical protein
MLNKIQKEELEKIIKKQKKKTWNQFEKQGIFIPYKIVDLLFIKKSISHREIAIFCYIYSKTIKFKNYEAGISLTYEDISKKINVGIRHTRIYIDNLVAKKIIIREQLSSIKSIKNFKINIENIDKWEI